MQEKKKKRRKRRRRSSHTRVFCRAHKNQRTEKTSTIMMNPRHWWSNQSWLLRGTQSLLVLIGLWVWLFHSFGSNDSIREWYSLLGKFCSDSSYIAYLCAGSALPVLVAGAVSILLTTTHSSSHAKQWMHQRTAAWLWVILPVIFYLATVAFNINRRNRQNRHHNEGEHGGKDEARIPGLVFLLISNVVGFVALWAFGYSLIPVAKQAPLWKVFGLDEIALVQTIHIWAGYLVVWGGTIHSVVYLLYWKAYNQ